MIVAKYIVEFIGTFIFLSVILNSSSFGNAKGFVALSVGIALMACIYFGGAISGGHFNPAVSTMFFLKNDLPMDDYIGYFIAQLLGGVCALYFSKYSKNELKRQ